MEAFCEAIFKPPRSSPFARKSLEDQCQLHVVHENVQQGKKTKKMLLQYASRAVCVLSTQSLHALQKLAADMVCF